jgi:uncharacterized protein
MTPFKLLLSLGVAALAAAAAGAADPAAKLNVKPEVVEKIKAALPDKAPAQPKKFHKVLIFSKTMGFRHGSIPVGITALTMMGKKTGAYSATHTEDDSYFEPAKLKEFDAVIMLNTTGDLFRPRTAPKDATEKAAAVERENRLKDSLENYVKAGGGLVGMHSATDTYHNWGAYNRMMGGTFAGHPWHKAVPVKNLAPNHPLNEVFKGQGFEVTDEIYQFRNDTALPTERKMLLALDTGKMDQKDVSKGGRKDGLYAVSWVSSYGKGHTFYCSLGHRDEIYYNPIVLRHYLAGIQYALGDLDADATASPVQGK